MGKKYLDIKKGSLEESILDIWQTAAEETDTKMDGRTKGYKSHRSKLESRRTKREEKKKLGEGTWALPKTSKQKAELKKLMAKPLPVGDMDLGYSDDVTNKLDNIIGDDELLDDLYDLYKKKGKKADARPVIRKAMKRLTGYDTVQESVDLDEARQLKDPKKEMLVTKGGKVITIDKKDAKEYLNKGWTVAESIEESVLKIWQTAAEGKAYEIGTDEYREYLERLTPGETIKEGTKEEYQKFFNAAMKKFKIDSPADLKSDEEKKKFFDYVDKNYKGEKDEELIQLAKEFKIDSMKEAIAKVWSFSEKVNKEKDEDKEIKGNKTLTGKKAAVVEIDPEPDLQKKSGNPSH